MNYNSEFEDIMDNINNIAYGYGFKNGIDWANTAQKRGVISWGQFKKYENAHNLRVRFSHGNARDIAVSYETYRVAKNFKNDIENSSIRKNRRSDENNNDRKGGNKGPKLSGRNNNSHSRQERTRDDYQDYYRKMYGLDKPQRQSLSYIAEEIQKELKIIRKYPKASYDDLIEAAYRIVETYTPGDFAAISTVYGCHSRMGLFNKGAARKELAEKLVASLKDYELRILMGE